MRDARRTPARLQRIESLWTRPGTGRRRRAEGGVISRVTLGIRSGDLVVPPCRTPLSRPRETGRREEDSQPG